MAQPLILGHVAAPPDRTPPSRFLGSAALVSAAFLGVNALAYVFTVGAARVLAPAAYGELAALLGVLLVAVVPATGLQTAGALALAGARPGSSPARLHTAGLLTAVGVAALALLAAPLVALLLHLPDPATALWLAALLVPHTTLGAHLGILQGSGRFARLAAVTAVFTAAKIGGAGARPLVGGAPAGAPARGGAGSPGGAGPGRAGGGAPPPAGRR